MPLDYSMGVDGGAGVHGMHDCGVWVLRVGGGFWVVVDWVGRNGLGGQWRSDASAAIFSC